MRVVVTRVGSSYLEVGDPSRNRWSHGSGEIKSDFIHSSYFC